jgi:hypothetical protein
MDPDISGEWHGTLDSGTGRATFGFKLEPTAEGGIARLATRTYGEL